MKSRWKTNRYSVYNLGYHLIWTPKYRKKVLTNGVDVRLKELLIKKSKELDLVIEKMEVMPDHVHIFVKSEPIHAPHYIVQQFKGYSSRVLRQEFSQLRMVLPTLWTRSYYCESVGNISEEAVKRYIENQKNV